MSGDLRQRIADVLVRDAFGLTTQTAALRQADAVIRELGIHPEWGLLDHTDSGLICDSLEEANSRKALPGESLHTRLVTDWVDVPQG